ncbi:hypothetical protein Tco_0765402 [Tanacetum coccineum]
MDALRAATAPPPPPPPTTNLQLMIIDAHYGLVNGTSFSSLSTVNGAQAIEEEQNQPEVMQELLLNLMKDLQILKGIQLKHAEQEEPTAQNFLINLNFPMADDDEYTVIYRKPKAITPDLPIEEPDNSLSMGDEYLNTIPETKKSSVENLVPIPSEFKGISEDICDMPSCDDDHFNAECGLINSLLSQDILIASPKIDFLPEEFVGELDFIDPILPGIDEDNIDEDDFDKDDCDEADFDKEEGEIDIDIFKSRMKFFVRNY